MMAYSKELFQRYNTCVVHILESNIKLISPVAHLVLSQLSSLAFAYKKNMMHISTTEQIMTPNCA